MLHLQEEIGSCEGLQRLIEDEEFGKDGGREEMNAAGWISSIGCWSVLPNTAVTTYMRDQPDQEMQGVTDSQLFRGESIIHPRYSGRRRYTKRQVQVEGSTGLLIQSYEPTKNGRLSHLLPCLSLLLKHLDGCRRCPLLFLTNVV
jgi:hypothetical protein